ncbi:MAG: AlpA family phage regulatory protein [Alicycliphilus sp.]|jgi:prophage regulatory protein|nr:MAG: AlpA family phage regulatory protein [Alicycliphilus sp.]
MHLHESSASPQGAAPQPAKLIRLPRVEDLTGLKRSAIYASMRAGTFPGSVRLSARAVAWREADVLAWCASRTRTGD